MMIWIKVNPRFDLRNLGFLPSFLSDQNPLPAAKQIEANYTHGGGWRPQPEFKLLKNYVIQYPDDPPMKPLARTTLRSEAIFFYEHAYLGIFQPDGTYEIARVD